MSFWKLIKGLKFKQLKGLAVLFFKHPLFMYSTIRATLMTMKIAQSEFPNIHGKHNKANAFRHALWNILIAKKCAKFSKNNELILSWTKRVTDWHEEFSPNEEIAKMMDLHNNTIGRQLFEEFYKKDVNTIVKLMNDQLQAAVKITSVLGTEKNQNLLVYLED